MSPGDVPELAVQFEDVTGVGAVVFVEEITKGHEASGTSMLVELMFRVCETET